MESKIKAEEKTSLKIAELRLGNWVEMNAYSKGKNNPNILYKKVDKYFYLDARDGIVPYADPIPLTPELLEKAGFSFSTDNTYHKYIGIKHFGIRNNELVMINGFDMQCRLCEIKYLHTLQNVIYFLTSSELKIEI